MTIQELIREGEETVSHCTHTDGPLCYCSGVEYQEWLQKAIRFVEIEFPGDNDADRFCRIAENAHGNGKDRFDALIGILKAFDLLPSRPQGIDIKDLIILMCENFNRFDVDIKRRHGGRCSVEINDEYDLQDCLRAILKLFIRDVRPEEYVPSYAGANSRVDFFLPEYALIIETKMTRSDLKDKDVGEQLTIDFHRYKELKKCNHLICFIYDRDSILVNPYGLISDLEKLSDDELSIKVIIAP